MKYTVILIITFFWAAKQEELAETETKLEEEVETDFFIDQSSCINLEDCFTCQATQECVWSISQDNYPNCTKIKSEQVENEYWFKKSNKCIEYQTKEEEKQYESYCGPKFYLADEQSRIVIQLKSSLPKYHLCLWSIDILGETVGFHVLRPYISDYNNLLSVALTSGETVQYIDNKQFNRYETSFTTDKLHKIQVYFRADSKAVVKSAISIKVTAEGKEIDYELTLIAICVIVLLFLIFVSAVITCYRCFCKKQRENQSRRIVQLYENELSPEDIEEKICKILRHCKEYNWSPKLSIFEQRSCCICLEDFDAISSTNVIILPCEHILHKKCAKACFMECITRKTTPKCPLCLRQVLPREATELTQSLSNNNSRDEEPEGPLVIRIVNSPSPRHGRRSPIED